MCLVLLALSVHFVCTVYTYWKSFMYCIMTGTGMFRELYNGVPKPKNDTKDTLFLSTDIL